MTISNKTKLALAMGLGVCASLSYAQTENTTASLTLSSAFVLAEVQPLEFGTIRASQTRTASTDGTNGSVASSQDFPTVANTAGVTINTDGSAPTPIAVGTLSQTDGTDGEFESEMTVIVDGSPGSYTVTGAAANTNLRISDIAATTLTNGSVTDASSFFDVVFVMDEDVRVVGGDNDGDLYVSATPNLLTDGTGAVGFSVGGTLSINDTADSVEEGVYTGTYTVTVSY